jgi:predicted MFS family arabinose efflux permease
VPQLVVAALSPWVGRRSRDWGSRPLLLIAFAALPIRGVLLAFASSPSMYMAVQVLDGVSAAVLAVMVPLIIFDATRGTGHFNLAQGVVGSGVGIGASLSTSLAGYTTDHFGSAAAFLGLAALAALGFLAVLWLMPANGRPSIGRRETLALTGPPTYFKALAPPARPTNKTQGI